MHVRGASRSRRCRVAPYSVSVETDACVDGEHRVEALPEVSIETLALAGAVHLNQTEARGVACMIGLSRFLRRRSRVESECVAVGANTCAAAKLSFAGADAATASLTRRGAADNGKTTATSASATRATRPTSDPPLSPRARPLAAAPAPNAPHTTIAPDHGKVTCAEAVTRDMPQDELAGRPPSLEGAICGRWARPRAEHPGRRSTLILAGDGVLLRLDRHFRRSDFEVELRHGRSRQRRELRAG